MNVPALIADTELAEAYNSAAPHAGGSHLLALRAVAREAVLAHMKQSTEEPHLVKFFYNVRADHYIGVWSDGTVMKSSDLATWKEFPARIPQPRRQSR